MKNTDKKNVFTLAWQFFKQTGYSFSDCPKKAWANIKLKAKMKSQIVEFHYKKLDGSIRQAFGTLANTPPTTTNRKPNENLFTYFDTVKNEWRSFYKFNILDVA